MNSGRKSMLITKSILVMLFVPLTLFGQLDTLIRYNIETRMVEYFEFPIPVDTPDVAWTNSSPAFNPNVLDMSQVPTPPLMPGSNFSELANAAHYVDVESYPASANVKIKTERIGGFVATGVFIGKNLILTNKGGLYQDDPEDHGIDSIFIYPAYDNGQLSSSGQTHAVAIYVSVPSYFGDSDLLKGGAIIEIAEDIGESTGWVGIQYCQNDSSYMGRYYFKFNYPNSIFDGDTTERYNGDTLYYSAGQLDQPYDILGYNRRGISGQGGSSLLSDVGDDVVSVGHLMYSWQSWHRKITYPMYCLVQNLNEMNNQSSINFSTPHNPKLVSFYPNPFNGSSIISFPVPSFEPVKLTIYSLRGQRILEHSISPQSNTTYEYNWRPTDDISSGVYLVQIVSSKSILTGKMMYVK